MQAPNKVYILPSQHNLQYDNGGEEYLRKSALLEWADGMKEGWGDIGQKGVILVLDELIDKINSL